MTKNYIVRYTVIAILLSGCALVRSTGKNPSGAHLEAIRQSANYGASSFRNLETDSTRVNVWRAIMAMSSRPENIKPFHVIPAVKTGLKHIQAQRPMVTWFGHSSFLITSPSANILVDPIFSRNAGPVPGMVKAFKTSVTYQAADMPDIDVLLISHDHYDHLDYPTVQALKSKVKMVVVPKGIGSHFRYWGYNAQIIHELDWYETIIVNANTKITLTPARHTSGRTLAREKTLWASFVINTDQYKLFYTGDGGYGSHFKDIGNRYGPFDLALMECGQYSVNWPHHHMFPEQTAKAAHDLHSRLIIPVHWAKFAESDHVWNASVKRLMPAANSFKIPVCIPKIGQPYILSTNAKFDNWWLSQ